MQSKRRRRAGRLGMIVTSVAMGSLLSIAVAGPAWGKGPESVTITGAGLDRPIELQMSGSGQDDTPPYVIVALTQLADPYYPGPEVELPADPPSTDLHARYTLTWLLSRPHNADPADYTVVQDIYPDAPGGPLIYTHPGSVVTAAGGGWHEEPPALRDTLAALGVPVSGLPTGLVDPSRAATQSPESATAWVWWLPLTATAGLTAGVGLGMALAKRRTRERPLPSVRAAAST